MRKVVALVQARLNSTRFPRKILADIEGKSLIYRLVSRLSQAGSIGDVVVIVPQGEAREIAQYVPDGIRVMAFPVPEDHLAARHVAAAQHLGVTEFVRVPSDNPCVDPAEVDRCIGKFEQKNDRTRLVTNYPYARNGYPDGVGCEVWPIEFMAEIVSKGSPYEWEHPHSYAHRARRVWSVTAPADRRDTDLRCDVNTPADLDFVRTLFQELGPYFDTGDMVRWVRDLEER